jgi:dihydrofolate reductase
MNSHKPIVSLIWAMSENRVIGLDNGLPWHLPADLKRFKKLTLGKPILMGRRTWESLPGLLPGRQHIVLTRDPGYAANGGTLVHSLEQALEVVAEEGELMIVGGAALYEQALPLADRLYLTLVHAVCSGDTYFPPFEPTDWQEMEREYHPADTKNDHAMSFIILERKRVGSEMV